MSVHNKIRHKIDILLLLLVLPLAGLIAAGLPVTMAHLEFPPLTQYVRHAGFSWPVFCFLAFSIAVAVGPFLLKSFRSRSRPIPDAPGSGKPFPWWGWAGLALTACVWVLAWTRFPWFEPFQLFTFSPLWFGYILAVNALSYRRSGRCMLLDRPKYFAVLFPVSACFWWFFEYLNRFVQNWYYLGVNHISALEYFLFATLPFSTVLPAVLGTFEYLKTFPRLGAGLDNFLPIRIGRPRLLAGAVFILTCTALAGIGVWPDLLFPALWLSPLLIISSYQAMRGRPTIFSPAAGGDWRRICLLALSALICGFFWEMWNYYSMAKWKYSVPFVGRFHVFEMPLLGFAGYLPFGLECALIADFILGQEEKPLPDTAAGRAKYLTPPGLVNIAVYINALILAAVALYFFIAPGFIFMRDLADKNLRGPGIPEIAWRLHSSLAPRYEKYARARVASGAAASLNRFDVPSTEWPMFGSVYFLWATESLQAAWEKDNTLSARPPAEYARGAIEAAVDLVMDPVHHTWVKQHWGDNYLHTQNLFFRALIIAALTSHENLIGNGKYRAILRDQADTLAVELEASPCGVLEDYPEECYPLDVLAAIACIKRADKVLGIARGAFYARAERGFRGKMLDRRGLIPWFVDDWRTGSHTLPSRGVGNSYALIYAHELWPDTAKEWYRLYEKYFWQDLGWAAGFREFPNDMPGNEFTYDVDAGPVIAGFSPAANAFSLAAARINGRLDHAFTLASQVLAACWPLPDGSLLGAKILSDQIHAPYLGEACLLFILTRETAPGMEIKTGGHKPALVYIGFLFYFGVGALFLARAAYTFWQWHRDRARCLVPFQNLQLVLWAVLLGGGLALLFYGHFLWGLIAVLVLQVLPQVNREQAP